MLTKTPLQRTIRSTAIYAAVLLVWTLLAVPQVTVRYIVGQLLSALVVGSFFYMRERKLYHLMPYLLTSIGVICLFIYGWVLWKRGLPDSWGELVVMALVISLPVIAIVMSVRDWWRFWRFWRVGATQADDESVRRP